MYPISLSHYWQCNTYENPDLVGNWNASIGSAPLVAGKFGSGTKVRGSSLYHVWTQPTNFTVELYFKEAIGQNRILFSLKNFDASFPQLWVGETSAKKVKITWYNSAGTIGSKTCNDVLFSLSVWNHIAVVFNDGAYPTVYLNGTLIGAVDGTGILPNSLFVGTNTTVQLRDVNSVDELTVCDEFRMWDVARSQVQIISCMGAELAQIKSERSNLLQFGR